MKDCGEPVSSKARQERCEVAETTLEVDNLVVDVASSIITMRPVKFGSVQEGRAREESVRACQVLPLCGHWRPTT